jgi:hypothetical protein
MISYTPNALFTAQDSDGKPLAGAKLYTYVTGTLTPKATYTDSTLGTPNTNPVILDSSGQASVWINSTVGKYRFILKTADDLLVWSQDGITVGESELYDLFYTAGDMVYASAIHTAARLAAGNAYEMIRMNAAANRPEWVDSPQSLFEAQGDILYAAAAHELGKLAKGTALQSLLMNGAGTIPAWADSPNSVLANKGGILYASAPNTLAQLAIGTSGQKLFVNASSDGVEWGEGMHLGAFTRDMDLVSGTVAITGVGFKPHKIVFLAVTDDDGRNRASLGITSYTEDYGVYNTTDGSLWGVDSSHCIRIQVDATGYYQGNVDVFGSDGFTMNWIQGGTPAGIMTVLYLALR